MVCTICVVIMVDLGKEIMSVMPTCQKKKQ